MSETLKSSFGTIVIKRRQRTRCLSLKLNTVGQLQLTAPPLMPKFLMRQFLEQSREQIIMMISDYQEKHLYQPGMVIGKTHLLKVEYDQALKTCEFKLRPNFLVARLPFGVKIEDEAVQSELRPLVQKILRKQAKLILLPRLMHLAKKYNFSYQRAKLSHALTRWGSCSSRGTISLNISLVNLPQELIDYVIIHELCHLRQMNHTRYFWAEVEAILPNYRQLEKKLKQYSPRV